MIKQKVYLFFVSNKLHIYNILKIPKENHILKTVRYHRKGEGEQLTGNFTQNFFDFLVASITVTVHLQHHCGDLLL